jgi:hypothetical protein
MVNLTEERSDEKTGKGLFAKCFIAERQPIITIWRPQVIALDTPRLKDTCYQCLGYNAEVAQNREEAKWGDRQKLQICTGCHTVRYCSKVGKDLLLHYTHLAITPFLDELTYLLLASHCAASTNCLSSRIVKHCHGGRSTRKSAHFSPGCIPIFFLIMLEPSCSCRAGIS